MQALIVEPQKAPYVKDIGTELEDLQKEVGGYIEAVYPFEDEACIICNDEGKFSGLELNRSLRGDDREIYDVIAGTFLIVGLEEESFGSLSQKQIDTYMEKYRIPELFSMKNGKLVSIPMETVKEDPILSDDVFSETRGNLELQVRWDGDPVNPRRFNENLGTIICFDRTLYGDNHEFNSKEEFLLDRLTAHFGDEDKAKEYFDGVDELCSKLVPAFASDKLRDDSILTELGKDHVFLPVFLCRHGGDTVSTLPFADKWDSGQIGWIYADDAHVAGEFGDWNEKTVEQAKEALKGEVSTWDSYLRDENYTYDLIDTRTGEVLDGGCWTGSFESLKDFAWKDTEHLQEQAKDKGGDAR